MTALVKKNAPQTMEVSSQSSLLDRNKPENDKIAALMLDLKLYIGGDKMAADILYPRFGVLSLKMRNTPMYAYDHPALMNISNTAFTDGVHIFVAADFLRQLVKEEEAERAVATLLAAGLRVD